MFFKILKEANYPHMDWEGFVRFLVAVHNSMNYMGSFLELQPLGYKMKALYVMYVNSLKLPQYKKLSARPWINSFTFLESVFYDASGYEQRMHLLWDLVRYYNRFKEVLDQIFPSVEVDLVVEDTEEGKGENRERVQKALYVLMERHRIENRPQSWRIHNNRVTINRTEEIVDACDVKPENRDKLQKYVSLTAEFARQFVAFVDKMVLIYKLDIASIDQFIRKNPRDEDVQDRFVSEKYATLRPTHRRAAVWRLIEEMGLRKSVDKTNLAAFVEAVTGGNITAKPQDTVSYKEPTADAKKAAAEWLKKIGIK